MNVSLSGVGDNDGKTGTLRITVSAVTTINRIEVPVKLRTFWVESHPGDGGVVKSEAAVPEDEVIN